MPTATSRPSHLADFANPPLNEVVLGVQFNRVPGYQQIMAGEVRNLFREKFPEVQDYPAISPQFEVFGINNAPSFDFGFIQGGQHDRFFFISADGKELIQFQQDRILHNWRKNAEDTNDYPRFEYIVKNFEEELIILEEYFCRISSQKLGCNQVEISYINIIPYGSKLDILNVADIVKVFQLTDDDADDANFSYRRALIDPHGNPYARLYGDGHTMQSLQGERALSLSFTVRGAPSGSAISDCIDFLKMAREVVVDEFEAVTTDSAQSVWGRTK